ncbi:hypothetical protein Q4493_11215 [Colwellia sp. 1_MG-2023]|uniref:YobI family P-loop NTPase n=1 Tax=Colwellia sp. 1_MG-2023 TaxID=3062649 RepID=UPI0026E474CB|nr:hypothetical protein [Colwellia sp. 1_MG-2023]MDO6446342.1 hypothetical protein [Colwellia sp. 1_MG-2023]
MFIFAWLWNNLKALFFYLIGIPGRILNWLKVLIATTCWALIKLSGKSISNKYEGYPDLCPTDNAQNVEPYIEKLNDFLVNRRDSVSEIAITAPYSGGKSSFINTFLRRYPFLKHTSISLASFKSTKETDGVEDRAQVPTPNVNPDGTITSNGNDVDVLSKIEKSIVQQLLYRTDSSKTPNSRFRRIFPVPVSLYQSYLVVISVFIWLSLLATGVYIPEQSPKLVLNSIFSSPSIYNIHLWLVSYFIGLPILIAKDLYRHLGKLNLTKFNPMKAEVAFDQQKKDSIFNIYLEEIIYYFATQKSEVVIFEDIDRFKEPDIFIKLKELNKLINDSKDVKQKVRFIYALRDNVFKGKDRTKFFDAIIPVIPIANKSNSYPQLKQLILNANDELDKSLDESFLRDISVYVDDMRMMKNIVSEFGIYKDILEPNFPKLDKQKLFSFIVYKNIYCDDFALLHNGKGMLAEFFNNETRFKKERELALIEDIESVENRIKTSDRELTSSVEELNSYCLIHVFEKLANHGITHLNSNPIKEVIKPEVFDEILHSTQNVVYSYQSGSNTRSHFKFSKLLDEIMPDYDTRRERIEDKALSIRASLNGELNALKEELDRLRGLSSKELLKTSSKADLFADEENDLLTKIKNEKLLMHLLEKGYVDKHYHLYITHFHEGHMTNSDMDYVMSVKDREDTDRYQRIINPKETLEYLDDDDYRTVCFFNYDIINHLIKNNDVAPLNSMIDSLFINTRKHHDLICESFREVDSKVDWLKALTAKWDSFWIDIIQNADLKEDDKNELLVNSFISIGEGNSRAINLINKNRVEIKQYIDSTESISQLMPENESDKIKLFKVLSSIEVKFQFLEKSNKSAEFLEHVLKNQMFIVNTANLQVMLEFCDVEIENGRLNYFQISSTNHTSFNEFFNQNVNAIAQLVSENLILASDENVAEILERQEIQLQKKLNIIEGVNFSIESLIKFKKQDGILSPLIQKGKFSPTWENLDFIISLGEDWTEVISGCMEKSVDLLASDDCIAQKKQLNEYKFILSSNSISSQTFERYNNAYELDYSYEELDSLSIDKIKYLINSDKLEVDVNVYATLKELDSTLLLMYSVRNFDNFVDNQTLLEEFVLEDCELICLLSSDQLDKADKKLLIEQRYHLLDENEPNKALIELISYPHSNGNYEPVASTPQLPMKIIRATLSSLLEYDSKVGVLLGQIQYISEEEVAECLRLIDEDLEAILDKPSYTVIKDSKINNSLLKALKYYDFFVTSWSSQDGKLEDDKNIRVNVKRK